MNELWFAPIELGRVNKIINYLEDHGIVTSPEELARIKQALVSIVDSDHQLHCLYTVLEKMVRSAKHVHHQHNHHYHQPHQPHQQHHHRRLHRRFSMPEITKDEKDTIQKLLRNNNTLSTSKILSQNLFQIPPLCTE